MLEKGDAEKSKYGLGWKIRAEVLSKGILEAAAERESEKIRKSLSNFDNRKKAMAEGVKTDTVIPQNYTNLHKISALPGIAY
jgi:hypothetical protein